MRCRPIVLGAAVIAALSPTLAGAGPMPASPQQDLEFRFDSTGLPGDVASRLLGVVAFAAANPSARIVLDAHCDPQGSSAYNIRLAIRRAEAVRQQLIATGVPAEQIVFAIYGEDGAHRATFAEDRRVTAWFSREPLASIIEQTLAGGGDAVTWHRPLSVAQIDAAPEPVASR